MNESQIFTHALRLATPAERAAFLDGACAGNPELRASVEALLQAHANDPNFLEQPAAASDTVNAPAELPSTLVASEDAGVVIAGRYRLIEKIGEGGMATVWMAQQQEPVKRLVAVKLIKSGMDSRAVLARFEAERQALAIMDHPNIAKVHDAGASGSAPFFVMELVKGVPITKYCDQHHLTPRQRLELFVPVCQAIQHAHQKGVIHRDIKPSNVLVALYDDRPVPKVIDFGVAKAAGQQLSEHSAHTRFGAVIGTVEYMSPEQASFNQLDVDTRSDIYALGVLLYELLAGSPPFTRKELENAGLMEMLRVIREQEPSKPSAKLSSAEALPALAVKRGTEPARLTKLMRGELDWIVMKALEKDRGRRYETANGFAMDVQRYLADEPVQAGPPSKWYRFRKFARRKRGLLVAMSLILLTLIAGIIGTTFALFEARAQHKLAREGEAQARQSEAEAKDVLSFFRDKVLAAARPQGQEGGLGIEIPLRKAIDAAEPEIAKAFKDRPGVEASIRDTMGMSYLRLGERSLAIAQLEQALKLRKDTVGTEHIDTNSSMNNLGVAYWEAGRVEEALPLFEESLEYRRVHLGSDDPQTLASMSNLALAYKSLGKPDQALPLFEESFKLLREKLGRDHQRTLFSMTNLAIAYGDSGRSDQSLPLFAESFELKKAKFGPEHPSTLISMMNLGMAYVDAKKLELALPLLAEVIKLQRAKIGPEHPYTLISMNSYGGALLKVQKPGEAEPVLRECLAIRQKKEPDDWTTFHTQSLFGGSLAGQQKFAEAEPQLLQGYEGMKQREAKIPPHSKSDLTDAAERLVQLYDAWGKPEKAAEWRKKTND